MKKLLIITVSFVALALTGCLKDNWAVDVYSAGNKPIIELEFPQGGGGSGLGSGLEFFGGGALNYPPTDVSDTVSFIVNIASTNTLSKALSVTVGPDANALEDNYSNDSINYIAFPDSDYAIINATQSIAAGQRQANFQIVFYPDKINTQFNYMLAVTVTSAGGYTVSGNFGHIYLHTIGNPLSGPYSIVGDRYNYIGSSGWSGTGAYPPVGAGSIADLSALSPELAVPASTVEVYLPYANLGSSGYTEYLTWNGATDATAAITSVSGNFLSAVNNFKVWTQTINWNGGKPIIHVVTTYTNGSGNDRIIDELRTHL